MSCLSCLWQLASEEHLKLNRSWNAAVKMIWNLPYATHTRFLESLSPVPHLESTLMSRYIGFIDNLVKTKKSVLSLIFSCSQDHSSQTGQNISYLLSKYGKLSVKDLILEKSTVKNTDVYPLHRDEYWKITIIEEISLVRLDLLEVNFDQDNLDDFDNFVELIKYLCTG